MRIPVHLRRTLQVNDLSSNDLGLKTMYEVWGWNSDSQPYWYWLVCPSLPPGMPSGESIYEEATFVGYFLKLLPYEDHQGVVCATPLLIGRLVWHPAANTASQPLHAPWIVAAVFAIVFIPAALWMTLTNKTNAHQPSPLNLPSDVPSVEEWLDQATDKAVESPIENNDEPHPSSDGNGATST